MSSILTEGTRKGAPDRPARRTHFPDLSPAATFLTPTLQLQSGRRVLIEDVAHFVTEGRREPGDEARAIYVVTSPTGERHTVADCVHFLECDCALFDRTGYHCRHTHALVDAGIVRNPRPITIRDDRQARKRRTRREVAR